MEIWRPPWLPAVAQNGPDLQPRSCRIVSFPPHHDGHLHRLPSVASSGGDKMWEQEHAQVMGSEESTHHGGWSPMSVVQGLRPTSKLLCLMGTACATVVLGGSTVIPSHEVATRTPRCLSPKQDHCMSGRACCDRPRRSPRSHPSCDIRVNSLHDGRHPWSTWDSSRTVRCTDKRVDAADAV